MILILFSLSFASGSSSLSNCRLWDLPIPYFISSNVNESAVLAGIDIWEKKSCISFRRLYSRPVNRNALLFQLLEGCWSHVDQTGDQPQLVSVGVDCESGDIVARLIGYSLGLAGTTTMMTNKRKYTKSGDLVPYESKFSDFREVNRIYCPRSCGDCLQCQNSGYPDPKNCTICRCPEGFGGRQCEKAANNVAQCGQGDISAQETFQAISERGSAICHYVLSAPEGHKIFFQIVSFNFTANIPCSLDYLELKFGQNMADDGTRFCDEYPLSILTEGNKLAVIYKGSAYSRFAIRFKSVVSPSFGYSPNKLPKKTITSLVRPFFYKSPKY